MDVFFSSQSPTTPNTYPTQSEDLLPLTLTPPSQAPQKEPVTTKTHDQKKRPGKKQASNIATNQASNIAILQFDDTDIEHLREAAYKAQTYRFSDREVEWIKDTAHRLSKEIQRGKVAQVDILRVGIKLFEYVLAMNKVELLKILDRMK